MPAEVFVQMNACTLLESNIHGCGGGGGRLRVSQTQAPPHADKAGAEALIESAGWVKNSTGFYEKDGAPLTLRLVAYPQRPGLVLMQPTIQMRLQALGIVVNTHVTSGSSWDELDAIMAAKDFDLLLWAQHTLPAGDPQWFLNSFFRSDGGNNHAGLNSSVIDGLLDDLGHTEQHSARVADTLAVHQAILEDGFRCYACSLNALCLPPQSSGAKP